MSAEIHALHGRAREMPAPPVSIESEQAVLGSLLLHNEIIGPIADNVSADDFSEEIHRRTFEVAVALIADKKPATPATLRTYIGDADIVPGLSVPAYLARLCSSAMPVSVAVGHARIVRSLAARRAIVAAAAVMDLHARDAGVGEDPASIATEHMRVLQSIASASGGDTARHASEYADELLGVVDGIRSGEITHRLITTGYADVDHATSGYVPGGLWITAGRPGMGKSMLANSTAYRCAKSGVGVLEFPLEIGPTQMTARHLADMAYSGPGSVAFRDIGPRANEMSESHVEVVRRAGRRLRELPIEIDRRSRVSVAQISAKVAQTKSAMAARDIELGLVIVDHLDFIHASDRYGGQRTQEIGEICLGLKDIAQTYSVCINLMCQLNRGLEQRSAKERRPTLADLRNSGDLEQVADVVMFLYREEYYLLRSPEYLAGEPDAIDKAIAARGKLEAILGKVRAGPTPTVHLFCEPASSSISSYARGGA